MSRPAWRGLAALVAVAVGGCAWLDEGPPTRACRTTRDCFAAQGEVCDPATLTCQPGPDAAAVTIDDPAAAAAPAAAR